MTSIVDKINTHIFDVVDALYDIGGNKPLLAEVARAGVWAGSRLKMGNSIQLLYGGAPQVITQGDVVIYIDRTPSAAMIKFAREGGMIVFLITDNPVETSADVTFYLDLGDSQETGLFNEVSGVVTNIVLEIALDVRDAPASEGQQ